MRGIAALPCRSTQRAIALIIYGRDPLPGSGGIYLTSTPAREGPLAHDNFADSLPLASAPINFFMTVRDIAFWIRSARADSRLDRLRDERGAASAFDHLYAGLNDPFGAE